MKKLPASLVKRLLLSDVLSSSLSAAALFWRGHVENGHATAPVNAIAHWFWPRSAPRQDLPSMRFTLTGIAVHFAAALLWCGLYEGLRSLRRDAGAADAAFDAAAVSAAAAAVDLACVPDRFTPGFEKRLTPTSLCLVYGGFAAGLALAGLASLRKH